MSGQGLNRTNNMLLILVSIFNLFILRVHKFPWKVQVHCFRAGRTEYHFTWDKQHVTHVRKYNREVEDKRLDPRDNL